MALATLSIDLEARLAKLQEGLDRAGRLVEQESAKIAAGFEKTRAALGAVGAALGGAFSAQVIIQFTRATIDGIDALNDFADAVGTSVENASALEDVAARTGTTLDTVTAAALKLNQQLNAADPDSNVARALQAIGLAAEDLRREDPAEALRLVAVALSQYADDGDKARLVQELFGKSVREVAPFLKDLAEQTQLVGKVTAEQAAEAEKFNKLLFELQKNANDLARVVAIPLVKAVNNLAGEFRAAAEDGRILLEVLRKLPLATPQGQIVAGVRAALGLGGAQEGPPGSRSASGTVQTQFGAFGTQSAEDRGFRPSVGTVGGGSGAGGTRRGGGGRSNELPLSAIRDATEEQKAFFLRSERESIAEIDRFLQQQATRTQEAGYAILDSFEDTKQRFLAAEKEGYEATDRYLRNMQEGVEKTKGLAEDLGLTFSSAFEDAIVQGGNLRDILKSLEQDILRIVTRKLITEPLGDFVSGAFKDAGGASGIFSKIGELFAGFFADGGFIGPGQFGIVGERGPEFAFGGRTGVTIQPASGMSVVINQNISGATDSRTANQIAAATARAVERASRRNN